MRKTLFSAWVSMFAIASVASADVLELMHQSANGQDTAPASNTTAKDPAPATSQAAPDDDTDDDDDGPIPWYLATGVSGSYALDAKIENASGAKFKFNTGFAIDFGVGYPITDTVAVELMTGFTWNGIKSLSATTPIFGQFTADGGDGHMYQVPLMANFVLDFPITKVFSIGLKAGIGMQWTKFNASDVNLYNNGAMFGQLSWDNDYIGFRYQAALNFNFAITHNIQLGVDARFTGASGVDIGPLNLTGAAVPGGVFPGNNMLSHVFNLSAGANLRILF